MPWWVWVLIGWVALAIVLAPWVGMALRGSERRARALVGDLTDHRAVAGARSAGPSRRRLPVPALAITLVGLGVTLEALGFLVRAAGRERGAAGVLSMDLPMSLPRMYITALFAAAALMAFLGASRSPRRRTWWAAVGAVAAVIAQVKGGGTVHVRALDGLGVGERPVLAAAGSALVAGAVLAGLWWLSRDERRDRRRVLGAFALYAVASVLLSALSSVAGPVAGAWWSAAATFVEESGEVVGAVTVLVAVLAGVAPRLVLPAGWPTRRAADAETVDAPGALPGWADAPQHGPADRWVSVG